MVFFCLLNKIFALAQIAFFFHLTHRLYLLFLLFFLLPPIILPNILPTPKLAAPPNAAFPKNGNAAFANGNAALKANNGKVPPDCLFLYLLYILSC